MAVRLREVIRAGGFRREDVAVSLYRIESGSAPFPYNEASAFFSSTYVTDALRSLVVGVVRRLAGGGGEKVVVLRSGFGGGKTHLLATVYYVVKEWEKARGTPIWSLLEGFSPPRARVCVFDGTYFDPWRTSLWEWLGRCVGRLDLVESYVKERRAPDAGTLTRLVEASPEPLVLIVDELGEYFRQIYAAVGRSAEEKRSLAEAVKAFFRGLYEALRSRDVLIVSLPDESAPYGEEIMRHVKDVEAILGRVGYALQPISRIDEVYGILRTRLFEYVDKGLVSRVVGRYSEFYEKYKGLVREDWTRATELADAFPFHPSFIRTLYERVGSIPRFQRTRDLIYVLAKVASKRDKFDDFVNAGDVDLFDRELKEFFTSGVDRPNYVSIVDSDLKRAAERSPLLYRVAAALYIYSLIGGDVKKAAADLATLRTLVVKPSDSDPHIVDKALEELQEFAWYVDSDGVRYWISAEPNLNKMLDEEAAAVSEDRAYEVVVEEIEKFVKRLQSPGRTCGGVVLRPVVVDTLDEVKDVKDFVLYVASPKVPPCDDAKGHLEAFFGRAAYKNGVYFLLHRGVSLEYAKYVVACEKLEESLEGERRDRLRKMCENKHMAFLAALYKSYSCLAVPLGDGLSFEDIYIDVSKLSPDKARSELANRLAGAIYGKLEERAKCGASAEVFYDLYLEKRLKNVGSYSVKNILEDLYRDPDLPIVREEEVPRILKALADAGKIVVSCGGSYYAKAEVPPEYKKLLDCPAERYIEVLRTMPPELEAAVREVAKRRETPVEKAVTCVEALWPHDKPLHVEVVEVEGEDFRAFKDLLKYLKVEKALKGGKCEVLVVEPDLSISMSATSLDGIEKLVRRLDMILEDETKVRIKSTLNVDATLDKVETYLEITKKRLKVAARGKTCR